SHRRLKPHANAADQDNSAGLFAYGTDKIGRLAQLPVPGDTNVRGKFALNLIPQSETELHVVKTRTNPPFRYILHRYARCKPGLPPQPLGNRKVVFGFEAGRYVTGFADKDIAVHLKQVGGQPLQADYGKASRLAVTG